MKSTQLKMKSMVKPQHNVQKIIQKINSDSHGNNCHLPKSQARKEKRKALLSMNVDSDSFTPQFNGRNSYLSKR